MSEKKKDDAQTKVSSEYKIPIGARLKGEISIEKLIMHNATLDMRKTMRKAMRDGLGGAVKDNPFMAAIQAVMVNKAVNSTMKQLKGGKKKDG